MGERVTDENERLSLATLRIYAEEWRRGMHPHPGDVPAMARELLEARERLRLADELAEAVDEVMPYVERLDRPSGDAARRVDVALGAYRKAGSDGAA